MRIGVDATCWANSRGYGRFAREVMIAMLPLARDDEFVCFVDARAADAAPVSAPNVRIVRVPQRQSPTVAASSDGSRAPDDLLRFTLAVRREPLDVFFSPSVYTYFPLPPGLPAVVTVHDAIAERHPELTLPSRRARLFWNAKVWLALRQSRLVLTVSSFSAREIAEVHRVPSDRIRIAVEAASPIYRPSESSADIAAAASRAGLPPAARWFAYVGGFNPHKHVDAIIRAHAEVVRGAPAGDVPHLVLAGTVSGDVFHGALDVIRRAIAEEGTAHLVHWPGYVPDEELRHLLSGAVALLLPSEVEGFGLPAVEAAACATPVIATQVSPLPELLEGGGIFIAPGDAPALAAGMRALLADEPARLAMGARARERASRLSWRASAEAVLSALREAAA